MDIEERVEDLENRVIKLENWLYSTDKPSNKANFNDLKKNLGKKLDIIGHQNLIVIALKLKPKQTKKELEAHLRGWGVKNTINSWLKGGNFNKRLLDKGIVIRDGKNSDNEEQFSLSRVKGEEFSSSIMEKYGLT